MKYAIQELTAYCRAALCAVGVGGEDAAAAARALVNADMRGVHSHGVIRMEGYALCLTTGGVNARPQYRTVSEGASFALIDADRGLGIPVSVYAEQMAIEKARKSGVAIVNVRNSHHHGACGYYSMMSAEAGMAGLAMSTGDVIMAAAGSAGSAIGNNPFSYALPAGKYRAICYDVAMSAVAAGKISIAAEEGRAIPLGWLLDENGLPTADPAAYARGGALLPFGGYKGYGLSVMVEALAGMLSGAALLGDIHAWNTDPARGGGVGHCFIAIDPRLTDPEIDLPRRAETMIEQIAAARKAPGVERIYFPGQIENEAEARARAEGVSLPPAAEQALQRTAALTGAPFEPELLVYQEA